MRNILRSSVLVLLLVCSSVAQTGVIQPGDNLVTDGVPAIPASLAEELGRYTEIRRAGFVTWHPTRREMLISTRFADTAQLHRVEFPGGARTQLTFFKDNVSSAAQYQPITGDFIVLAKDVGGNEFYQNYRYDLATGAIVMLTDGKSRNSLGRWSRKGDRMAYTSTRRNGRENDIYVISPTDPKSDRLLAQNEGSGWSILDWSPDDNQLLLGQGVSINESYLWLLNATTGERTLLTPKGNEKVANENARFSADGKAIYLTTDRGSEFMRLARLDLATREYQFLTEKINWDVDDFALSPRGTTIAFITNEEGYGVLRLLDTRTGQPRPTSKLPRGIISGIEWHNNDIDLGFNFSSGSNPTDAYSLDTRTGKVERWTRSETGGLRLDTFADPELIRWRSFDGREISGFYYAPASRFTGKRPVVISIHGGPEGQYRPGAVSASNYYYRNELGVAMIYPNVRGSSGYGKTFLQLDNGFQREDSYKDIGALLDWIKTRPELDADRVLVTGGSYGGHMSFAIATYYGNRIRAAVPVVGMSNLVTFLERTEAYRRDLRRPEYGDERDPKMREFLLRIAPLNNVQKITTPMLIVQGGNDPRVPLNEAEQMLAALKKNGTPVWYLMAKDEGHGFRKKKNVDFQFFTTVMFIRQYLLN